MKLMPFPSRSAWFWLGIVGVIVLASLQFGWILQSLMQQGFRLFPYQDDWGTPVNFLTTYADGSRSLFEGLWRQHNESRKVTYKLLTLLIDRGQRIDSLLSLWLSFFIRIVTVAVVCWPLFTSSKTAFVSWRWASLAIFAYGALIFGVGPANLFNGLWFVQTSFYIGILFSVFCIQAFWGAVIGRRGMHLIAALSGSLAIFSFSGNTSLLPVCSVCALALIPGSSSCPTVHWKPVAFILCVLAMSTILFFWNWEFPPAHLSLRSDDISVKYVVKFMAGFYQFLPPLVFVIIQAVVFGLIFMLAWIGLRPSIAGLLMRGHVSLVIALSQCLFLILLAVSSSVARGGTLSASNYALEYRYNSISILFSLLIVSILFQFASIFSGRKLGISSLGLTGLFVGLGCWANVSWMPVIQAHFAVRSGAVACLTRYTFLRRKGAQKEDLSELAACAKPLFDKGPELIYQRFSRVCSSRDVWRGSRTIRGLCGDFGLLKS